MNIPPALHRSSSLLIVALHLIILALIAGCATLESPATPSNTISTAGQPATIEQTIAQDNIAAAARKATYSALLSTQFEQPPNVDAIWNCFGSGQESCEEIVESADAPAPQSADEVEAGQLQHAQSLFDRYPLYEFEPSWEIVRAVNGEQVDGEMVIPATVSAANEAVLLYSPAGESITLEVNDTSLVEMAEWFDPRSGEFRSIDKAVIRANVYTPPQSNDVNDADYVLIIHTSLSAAGKNAPIPDDKP